MSNEITKRCPFSNGANNVNNKQLLLNANASKFKLTWKQKSVLYLLVVVITVKYGFPNLLYVYQYMVLILKLILFKKKKKYPSLSTNYSSIVRLYDMDFWLHMNNASYLRHAELARVGFFVRTQFWQRLRKTKWDMAFVAVTVRYRRQLTLFSAFTVKTRAISWNTRSIIVEQKFVHPQSNFVHAIVFGKYILTKGGKRVREQLANNEGFHSIEWYANASSDRESESESESDSEDEEEYDNAYECRNRISKSLRSWMNFLDHSSSESQPNLMRLVNRATHTRFSHVSGKMQ